MRVGVKRREREGERDIERERERKHENRRKRERGRETDTIQPPIPKFAVLFIHMNPYISLYTYISISLYLYMSRLLFVQYVCILNINTRNLRLSTACVSNKSIYIFICVNVYR